MRRVLVKNSMSKKQAQKKHYEKNKEARKLNTKNYLRRIRASALAIMGGECVHCGFSDERALQIDHINGGGTRDLAKKGVGGSFHNVVIRSFLAGENKYQLLCANCNWIKRVVNKEVVSGTRNKI